MSNYRIEKLEKSLEGATKVIFDHSMRKVEYEGVVDYNLFPYQIKDREKFYQRDHPKQISPLSFSFKSYWSQFAKKSIEGIWVEDEGTWVYMMPELFHYINYIRIMGNKKGEEGKRQIMQPDLSSLEWVGFSYIYAGDGFSGFIGDEDYTCNRLVERLYLGEELNEYDLPKLKNCYKPNGKLKTFVDPWEYLTRFYLVDNPRGNLGKPLYENRLEDCIITGSRSVGKSYMIYPGKFMHSWTFGSVRDFSEENKAQLSNRNLFAMGAGAKDPLNRSLKLIKSFYDAQPGKYRYPDPDRPNYMGPYYKNVQGAWEAGAEIQHLLKERNNIDALVGSSLQMNVITPDRKRIAAGDRFLGIYIEEAGFLEYLPEVWGANKDSMEAEGYKVGRAYATGTSGDIKAVDGIKKLMENPRGYQLTPIPNYWKNPDKEIGLFLSALYRFRNYQDDNGNRDLNSAIQFLAKERTKNAEQMDSAAFDDYILYAPMNPDEMLRPNRRSFLPGAKAQERLSDIDAYDLYALNATEGDFKFDPGEEYGVGFKKGSEIPPIRDYQLDRARVKLEGCPIVYEHPDGYIPENLYWVIFDPVSKPGKGESIDASLNSVIVYKWFYTGSSQTLEDNIVAEWVGRHDQLEDTYELVVKMAKYFNAKIFPETNTPGFVDWCTRNNYSQLLQEEAVLAMKEINPKFTGRRGKVGFSIYGDRMKPWLLQRFKGWLLRKRGEDQEGNFESYTIDNILSERLLNEIANFNEKGNFDHISSMLGLMLLITQFDHEPPNLQVIKQRDEPTFEYKLVKRKPRRSIFEQSSYI